MKNFNKICLIFITVFLTVFVTTCATTGGSFGGLGRPSDIVPLNNRVLTGVLPNGLRYFILENSLPENRAHLSLIVNAGSVLEREDERGFAHFVEHLAFNGTLRFPNMELADYLRSLGMRFGADLNAYVSYNQTVYHFNVPVENINGVKRIPERALAILDDWTYSITFNPEEVENEKLVVLEEFRWWLGAMERVNKIVLPILFAGSAYENREPLGLEHVIENSTPEQLKAFYERWYTADNMALVFIGDFDGKVLQAELEQHFNIPAPASPVNRPRFELPPPKNGNFHIEIITDPEMTTTYFDIYFKQKHDTNRGTLRFYRESIINSLIASMLRLRFDEIESNPQAAATESWAGMWRWSSRSRFYFIGTQPKTDNVEEALRELLLEKESVRRFGFTQSELDRAKLNLISSMERRLSEKDRMESTSFRGNFVRHFLYNDGFADIEWEVNAVNSLLPGIGMREISQAVQNYFSANDINVFLLAPQAEEENLPSAERIRAIFRQTQNESLTPRQDISLSGDLLENLPVPGSIISETLDAGTGAHIITLSNGASVILMETENRNNEIVLYAIAKGGLEHADEDSRVSVNLLSEMINVSGIGPYSRTELINKLAGKQASVSFYISRYMRGFRGSSTTRDIAVLFEMLHLFFTNPSLDERAVAAMIDQYRTNLAHQDENPQRYFSRELNKILTNNHPLFLPLELEDMDKVSLQQAYYFLNKCINPGDYTFIFTGNFDMNVMRELLAVYIASIPDNVPMNQWLDPGIIREQEGRRSFYRGVDERTIVYLNWSKREPVAFNEKENQIAAVLSRYLDILLTDEIREKMGGVYSISAGAYITVIPSGEYGLNVMFVCDPERAEELIASAHEHVVNIIRQPVNTNIFNKAKEAVLMEHERAMQNNMHIAQSFSNSFVLYNTPLNRLNLRPQVINEVTEEDMQALCRQMLSSGPLEVILFPESRR
jgi:zinc protease